MNRFRAYYPFDEAPSKAGDTFFRGLDNRRAPAQLEEGMVSTAKNVRMRYGRIQPRGGNVILRWMKEFPSYDGLARWTAVYGCGRFWNPATGIEHWLVAADGGVWNVIPNMPAQELTLPSGTQLNATTFSGFVQCFNGVMLLLGEDERPLYMSSLTTGFTLLTGTYRGVSGQRYTGTDDTTTEDYPLVNEMPPMRQGCYMGNRMWGVFGTDTVVYSDLFSPTAFFILSQLRINEGDGDRLVAVYPYDKNTLLCFKDRAVLRLDYVYGDLSSIRLVPMTTKYGCVSANSIVDIGTDVYWMSERGVTSLRVTQQNELQGTSVTLSEPIEGTMARINWLARAKICAESWNNYLYFAVPLDGSSTNNAILVYDLLNGAWASVDEAADATCIVAFQKIRVRGQERLCAVCVDKTLRMLEEGSNDEIYVTVANPPSITISPAAISTRVVTRGYLANEWDRKRWKAVKLQLAHNNPSYSVGTVVEGAFETASHVSAETKTRGRSVTANGTDFDETATSGDASNHALPYREDYSLLATTTGFRVNNGVYPDQLQTSTHGFPIGERGHTLQLDITNTQGRLEVVSIGCEATEDERRLATRY